MTVHKVLVCQEQILFYYPREEEEKTASLKEKFGVVIHTMYLLESELHNIEDNITTEKK